MSLVLRLMEDRRTAYFDGNTFTYRNLIKAIPGNDWKKKGRRWVIPVESVGDAKRIMPGLQLDPEIEGIYADIKARSKQAIAIKTVDPNTLSTTLQGLKGQLYPYQAQGKAFLDTFSTTEGGILAFDMGLGKSISSLATFIDWKNRGIVDHCLVICPSPLKYSTWEKELLKWTELSYIVVDGDKPTIVDWDDGTANKLHGQRLREVQYMQWRFGTDVIIMNYELFLPDQAIVPKVNERWAVIMDECFPYDTKVLLEDGSYAKIGDLVECKTECKVLSYDIKTNKLEAKPIVYWHKNLRKTRLVKVQLVDGTEIKMTENHKVYTKNRGYVQAKDLLQTDEVILWQD